jgi:PAS domain S-box-containing protein
MNRDSVASPGGRAARHSPARQPPNALPPEFVELAQLAAGICGTPSAAVVLNGWGEARVGEPAPTVEPPERDPFYEHVAAAAEVFEVRDAGRDKRFAAAGAVPAAPSVRGYAACALRVDAGEVLGTLAVYDVKPRRFSKQQLAMLASLARQCAVQAALRARVAELEILNPPPAAPSEPEPAAGPQLADFVGTISDFTDLVTARGELHRAETLLRNTFDQAPIGIAYADRAGKFLKFNGAFCALLGYDPAELVGCSMGELTHAEDVEAADTQFERLWKGEAQFLDFEKRYRRRDGTYLWVRTTTALLRDGSRADRSVEYLRDITQRKELAAQLVQQRILLEAVIGDLPVALLACDVEGRITHYNRAAAELRCIHPGDAAASAASDRHAQTADAYLMDGATPVPASEGPLARALRGETISNLELIVMPHEATPRTTLSSARRLIGPDGQTLGAVAVIQDTTERKRQEVELERVHKELMTASREAGMAEVATNVLHNVGNILNSVNISASLVAERVRQSKANGVSRLAALLQEQGEGVGRFITEDERGKRIPDYLGALGEQLQSDQRAALEELTLLRNNLEHIKDTVTMQQSYAKLCGVSETLEVVDLVEDSLRLNAGAFVRHGVTLQREFGEVPKINVDKHKVLQILVNLVRNAKYACDDSGRTDKRITLRVGLAPLGVRISVIDNGIGIPPENMSRLFRHGFTTRASGHGFGLHSGAIAAHELGGTLHAESEGAGRGAAFILELPLTPPQAAHP